MNNRRQAKGIRVENLQREVTTDDGIPDRFNKHPGDGPSYICVPVSFD
jgi:hypothetical protein